MHSNISSVQEFLILVDTYIFTFFSLNIIHDIK